MYRPAAQGEAHLWRGSYAAAERGISAAIETRTQCPSGTLLKQRSASSARTLNGLTLVRLGRDTDARVLIEPEAKFERDIAKERNGDVT